MVITITIIIIPELRLYFTENLRDAEIVSRLKESLKHTIHVYDQNRGAIERGKGVKN
jgi:hypothetical protein